MSHNVNDNAMHEYLDALLFEPEEPQSRPAPALDTARVEKLLHQASALQVDTQVDTIPEQVEIQVEVVSEPPVEVKPVPVKEPEPVTESALEPAPVTEPDPVPAPSSMSDYQQGSFQALFFSVAGLKLAVPLKSLGGIHEWKEPNTIFGKPDWYMGIMTSREEKLNTVDTARWVMPEKYNQAMADALQYRYLIMLNESRWGLACESLVTTESLTPDDVQWRKVSKGKRPWLAGVVRDKMCAILDVDAMVEMLEQGLNSHD